jgi:UDP-N-acetylmuramate dehydrogenase
MMPALADMPSPDPSREREGSVRGKLTPHAPLAPLVWFKTGGPAEQLFEPADRDDLVAFLQALDPAVPVYPLGLGSNLIVRDGGMPGVVVRLGKAFAKVERVDSTTLRCGGGASGILVSSTARDAGIAGVEFLRSIPGTVGGFVRMNGGAYGRETADVLVECEVVLRSGERQMLAASDLGYSYRHSELPDGAIVVSATFCGMPGDPAAIQAEMDRIAAAREASQPLRSRTGGSTFKNPAGHKAWEVIDAAGCRGLRHDDAQVSEKHCNFLLNLGQATSADIEALGEEVRAKVKAHSGVELEWEIQRVGHPLPAGERDRPRSGQGEGTKGRGKTPDLLLERSRQLRLEQTEAEAQLWSRLRAGRLNGLKFRRQVPIGGYIVDFLCPAAKLVVELDGSQHAEQVGYDTRRSQYLEGEGYRVLRVWNNDVLARADAVLQAICAAASPLPGASRLSLSPEGRGT